MTKVLTFSRTFPANHPKAGQCTYFVEKFWNSFNLEAYDQTFLMDYSDEIKLSLNKKVHTSHIHNFFFSLNQHQREGLGPKHHTIRTGNNWKVGDKFSPRVWSGKPYNSPQITIAPDIEILKVWKFDCDIEGVFYLDGKWIDVTSTKLPENDGLSSDDLLDWFPVGKIFSGQIICWNSDINY